MYNNINNNRTDIDLNFIEKDSIFKTNKIGIKYINIKLKNHIKENKENLIYNNIININNKQKNFIYHKKNLKYVNNSKKNYRYDKYLKENLKKIMNYNITKEVNKRKKYLSDKYNNIYYSSSSLSPENPYKKVGNILTRNNCQFSKNNNNNSYIQQNFKRCKSCKFFNINKNKGIYRLKALEDENYYLKKMIRISEKKLRKKKKELEKILTLQNICEKDKKRKLNFSPISIDQFTKRRNKNKIKNDNRNKYLTIEKEEIENLLKEYLEEPKEQIAPIPYSEQNK